MKFPPLLTYGILRVLAFVVPLAVMLFFPIFRQSPWIWVALVCAALIGISLSVLFLRRPLDEASARLSTSREGRAARKTTAAEDASVEDAALDESETPTATEASDPR